MEKVVIGVNDHAMAGAEKTEFDYSQRSQWLRAAVLGANDGLVSTASLMMGVGAVKQEIKAMMLSGFAGLMAGACSMAIGEFVSVYSQLEIEVAQLKRDKMRGEQGGREGEEDGGGQLPRPFQAASASAMAFTVGAIVPLLSAAFVREYWVRVGVVAGVSSVALVAFGATGAVLGRSPVVRSAARVLIGGWAAMLLTFGLMKLVGSRVM
ncbi:vacuolar iron transporter homolog 4-like [Nymphaea colorata]|nr:vacuolar iron transporter homolog 4-like [Nymphaea colorata]